MYTQLRIRPQLLKKRLFFIYSLFYIRYSLIVVQLLNNFK